MWARASTGLKVLLILMGGLFPLGLIAILASLQSARESRDERAQRIHAELTVEGRQIDSLLARAAGAIRAASVAVAASPPGSPVCLATLRRLSLTQAAPGRYALFGPEGGVRCASPGFAPPPLASRAELRRSAVEIAPDGQALRFLLYDPAGRPEGAGEFGRDGLARVTLLPGQPANFDLELLQGERTMRLWEGFAGGALVETVRAIEPVAGGRLELRIARGAAPATAAEALLILMPVLMWVGAAVIGWLVINRLLVRPLARMERAVAAYQPGDRHLDLPTLATPAREIGELGLAFNRATQTVARHEAELEAALARQTRLVREVHHRVKNNLQVVASLLNLHARGATSDDVAAAYASIQRRVDALAVVHRNHFAELEENRGVSLRSLLSELGANLRATAPASAAGMQIRLAVEPHHVTQDVAVSVAFLVTELAEFAMFCGGHSVSISLAEAEDGKARLAVESDSLRGDAVCDEKLAERFERVVTGLSRQLRSSIHRDKEAGGFAIDIAVLDGVEE